MTVASAGVTVEQAQSEQVDQQPRGSDPGHHFRAFDLVGLGEAFDGFQEDGEAQRRQKHGVDQSPHHLCPDPSEGVLFGRMGFLGEPHGHQSHDQFRQHRQRRGHPTDHHFDDEKHKSCLKKKKKKIIN
uniref:Uncharacterized protein n=1 Tax=Takifugu rubripes TaxID=31033 RepID=A0A3B5KCX0_TAKRU